MSRVRVLIVDDMPLARQVLAEALRQDPDIEVVGVASDAHFAKRKLETLQVDVLTLDVDLPGIDGLSFLRGLLAVRPVPVVVVSALTRQGGEAAMRALELGAVEVVAKADRSLAEVGQHFARELGQKVKAAARARLGPRRAAGLRPGPAPGGPVAPEREPCILLSASTGGVTAIPTILGALGPDSPPVVCVQHIPGTFSASFAERMNELGSLRVAEARGGEVLERGHAYVAPGGRHLLLTGGQRPVLEVGDGPPLHGHRPSVDVTFRSALPLGRRVLAALLTGMGSDGAQGLAELRAAGALTLAQDEQSCVAFGMPKEAIRLGGADRVAPLEQIADILNHEARRRRLR